MSLFKNIFRKNVPPAQVYDVAKSTDITSKMGPGWTPIIGRQDWSSASELWGSVNSAVAEAMYSTHPIVRACANLIGETATVPELEVGHRTKEGGWEKVEDHPLAELFRNPHVEVSRNQLIRALAVARSLTGLAYIRKIHFNRARGDLSGLWPVPSSWVEPIPWSMRGRMRIPPGDKRRYWAGYRIVNTDEVLSNEDLVTLRSPDPGNPATGSGCVMSAWRSLRVDLERENYQMEALVNLRIPGLIVKTSGQLTDQEKDAARKEIRDRIGEGQRGSVIFVSGSGDVGDVEVVDPMKDSDVPGLTELAETRICASFGISPILVHSRAGLNHSTYANYETALKAFYLVTMAPVWENIADGLTSGFREELGEGLKFRFRYDELPAFQEDQLQRAEQVVRLRKANIISLETAHDRIGVVSSVEKKKLKDEEKDFPVADGTNDNNVQSGTNRPNRDDVEDPDRMSPLT